MKSQELQGITYRKIPTNHRNRTRSHQNSTHCFTGTDHRHPATNRTSRRTRSHSGLPHGSTGSALFSLSLSLSRVSSLSISRSHSLILRISLCLVSLGWKGNEEQRRGKKKERKEKKEECCVGWGEKKEEEKEKKKEIKGKGTRVWFERGEKWIRLSLPTKS
jgi:hypothetical protein